MATPDEQPRAWAGAWSWRDLQVEVACVCTEEPAAPEVGAHWYNPETLCLCVWDGDGWEPVPHD
jgi:hypothetical protein